VCGRIICAKPHLLSRSDEGMKCPKLGAFVERMNYAPHQQHIDFTHGGKSRKSAGSMLRY